MNVITRSQTHDQSGICSTMVTVYINLINMCNNYHYTIWAASSEFVSSSIPSWQILTAYAQPFRGARDLTFCLEVPLDSLYPRKPMTFTKMNFWTYLEANIYFQELSNHIIILFCNISEPFDNFSPRILQHCNSLSRHFVYYKYWLFIKLQKMEGEVFIALGTSQGNSEPPRCPRQGVWA